MDRDYDRAKSGGRFGDDYGQFSRSSERDHSMSGARRAYTDSDMDRDMSRDRGWDRDEQRMGSRDWDPSRRGSRSDYEEQVYRADWDRDRVRYRGDDERAGSMAGGERDRRATMGAMRGQYGAGDNRYNDRGDWREQRAGYARTARVGSGDNSLERDRAQYQYGRGEPTWDRNPDDQNDNQRRYERRDTSGAMSDWRGQDWAGRSDYYTTGGRSDRDDRDRSMRRAEETWMVRGPHTGRGPQGYQRSDDRIHEDACERLTHHGGLDARDIDVSVSNGEITLAGMVDNRRAKRAAEDAVEDISGVREVHNRLRLRQSERRNQSGDDRMSSSTMTSGMRAGSVSTAGRGQVAMGMDVVGSDMSSVGTVKETRGDMFLIDRSLQRDIWAPFSAIQSASGTQIVLRCAADEVDDQGWDSPPIMGGDADQTAATTPTT